MKSNFKQSLWVSFGVIFGTILVASAALYFLSTDLAAQAEKIITDKALIAEQTGALDILASLKSDAMQAAPYAAAMGKLLPPHDELIGFPQWLTALGQAHNVSVSAAFQGNNVPVTDSAPGNDSFSMNASGASADLITFLRDLETRVPGFLLAIDTFDLGNTGPSYQLSAPGRLFSR